MMFNKTLLSKRSLLHCISASFFAMQITGTSLADWPTFLGPGGNPVSTESVPLKFSVANDGVAAENIAWRVPIDGRGVGGPIVVDGKVITTSSGSMEGRWMHVIAIDEATGKVLWNRSTKSTGRPFCHPTSANAAPTPCSDGERVFAFFSSNDLVCYDLDGNLQWFRSLVEQHPLAGNDVGMGSSPIVIDGVVVVSVECQADAFVAGLDAETGETLWEVPRPKKANWASPKVITDKSGAKAVVIHGLDDLMAIEPQTGKQLWQLELRCSSVASGTFADGKLYVPAGGLKTFEIASVAEKPELSVESNRLSPGSASLLVSQDGVIGLNRTVLVCVDFEGNRKWVARLEDAGQIWSTPVLAGDHLYAFGMNGKCFTVAVTGDKAEVIQESELGEEVLGSPAVSNNAMYVRSTDALWKIGG
jgi:outer membrane protein assembly factor BamB